MLRRVSSFAPVAALIVASFTSSEVMSQDAAETLQKAIYTEEAVGDLDKAIELYEKIIAASKEDQRISARARLHLGIIHLKRGESAAAAKQFNLLIEKHADQAGLVKQAKNLLPKRAKSTGLASLELKEVMETFRSQYVDEEVLVQDIDEEAIRDLLKKMDPDADYLTARQLADMMITINEQLVGIGIMLTQVDEQIFVKMPIAGGPAMNAGVLADDEIMEVDGKAVPGMKLAELVRLIRGRIGTKVILTLRNKDDKFRKVEIVRATINLKSVTGSGLKDGKDVYHLENDPSIGYVRIASFGKDTTRQFEQAIDGFAERDVKGLVIDLRNCPGGMLTSALEIADIFVNEGVLLKVESRKETQEKLATDKEKLAGVPIIFLVNSGTASAAEILSGSLQSRGRAVVAGERTFGKGTVQSIHRLRSGNAIKLTSARFYLPNGRHLQRPANADEDSDWGVNPDKGLAFELTADERRGFQTKDDTKDRVLDAAVEHLKKQR